MTAPTDRPEPHSHKPPAWSWVVLLVLMAATTWWRGHTFGPSVRDSLGFAPWPVVQGQTEPLDCDEAAYGYIGRRLVDGATMYRDLTENKPPLGYWTYALAIWLGGPTELTIRLLPIPLVLATLALVFWIGATLRSAIAGCLAAFLYALLSTDPYLYGNGSQLELLINLFSVASLALAIKAFRADHSPRASRQAFAAGCCVAAASLVRQVAALNAVVYVIATLLPIKSSPGQAVAPRRRLALALGVVAGFLLTWGLVALILLARGSLADAYEDVIRYGGALATDTPADPNAPPFWMRLVTGNADPEGRLPSPFGKTDYLVWWGTGTWPLWLAGLAGVASLLRGRVRPGDRLVAAWTLSALVQVALPRLFWAHYYLTPTPGLALAASILAIDLGRVALAKRRWFNRLGAMAGLILVVLAVGQTLRLQTRYYLLVPSEELTIRYKGGRQWVVLRALGRELGTRAPRAWEDPKLLVWGWQSPLFFYSGLDGVTPHFFVDPLLKAYASEDHPLITPRLDRVMRDVEQARPALIFAGDPPFPALANWLRQNYLRSRLVIQTPDGRGLWVEPSGYAVFEAGPEALNEGVGGQIKATR